eukprot:TRINITY_DN994_c0_g1_i2.p1 TRINITY_DN994_c0_g1~~TRINITY_DN994_c0_g1_i2.p1  ORF type:complete len:217 (-),score=41.77 TRINITY_DN994_c0_g1_i2:212-778(-)
MRANLSLNLISFLLLFILCQGEKELGGYKIEGHVKADPSDFSKMQVQVYGDSGVYFANVRQDGSFTVYDVPSGAYQLEIVSTKWVFPSYRVDISARYNGKVKARLAADTTQFVSYPLLLEPSAPALFFQKRDPLNPLALLENPMILMTFITFLMLMLFPKLGNLDPETLKELQKSEAQKREVSKVKST